MTSIQERLQIKREPLDKWSIREQLSLASAVSRSGDQNWMSVSRALKSFGEPNRPADWFHQKNCAAQYGALLGNVETPKRKKRTSGNEIGVETPTENILRRLLAERQAELKQLLAEEKTEYKKLQEDMLLLQSGKVSEEQLDHWCKEIDEEEYQREQEATAHAQWLKERELRKQEIERTWRPVKSQYHIAGQKRKNSEALESQVDTECDDSSQGSQVQQQQSPQLQQSFIIQPQEPTKPALSPLLTSLLKSPSQVQNVLPTTTSILHSAITNQVGQKPAQNPTIASLLNSSTGVTVSPGLQHLVSTAIGQDPSNIVKNDNAQPLTADILDDANLPNLKIDDLASSILVQDGPLPEIKKEEVDDIISEIIENAHDIVTDPEQHLELDGNGDINLELDDLDDEEDVTDMEPIPDIGSQITEIKEVDSLPEKLQTPPPPQLVSAQPAPIVDPFEFQEDPVIFDTNIKPSGSMKQDNSITYTPLYQQQPLPRTEDVIVNDELKMIESEEKVSSENLNTEGEIVQSSGRNGSVEIVEVIAEEVESQKELNQLEIQDIVHSTKEQELAESLEESTNDEDTSESIPEVRALADQGQTDIKTDIQENIKDEDAYRFVDKIDELPLEPEEEKIKIESEKKGDDNQLSQQDTQVDGKQADVDANVTIEDSIIATNFSDDLYDNMSMEVKIDKTGKTRRDYSRTKKKDDKNEKGFNMLLAIEKTHLEDMDMADESLSDNTMDNDKREPKARLKSENERSNSPWTEEEDINMKSCKRRNSTPGTPVDSFPNSPASSIAFYEDDRDYRNWKKSVMLVYNRLASNKYSSLFLKPITDDQAPGYSSVVYRPMDLQTIKKHIDSGVIRTSLEFKRDVMLMFTNAMMYNKTNDTVYNMAVQMQQESINAINILLQAQGEVNVPLRRETRTSESGSKRKRQVETENTKNKKRKED